MSSLLDAVSFDVLSDEYGKMEAIGNLPIVVDDISIMTIRQAFIALENSNSKNNNE